MLVTLLTLTMLGCALVFVEALCRGFRGQPERQAYLVLALVGLLGRYYDQPQPVPGPAPLPAVVQVSFALPAQALPVPTWQQRVDQLGARIAAGFGISPVTASEFAPWLLEAAERHRLSPDLLAGLVLTESSFRKRATSVVGAIGPAQVRPEYWRGFCGTKDLHDPAENIYCGAMILAHFKDRCGDEACALKAYNIGPHERRRGVQIAGQRYVTKVGQLRDRLAEVVL